MQGDRAKAKKRCRWPTANLHHESWDTEKAVAYLKDQRIVGVDTETRPSFKRGTTHKVALLQISTQDTCFLFRLNRIGMPDSLQEFLMSDTLKIGLSLKDDFNSLRKREDVHPDR